jgi:hypothetical protein
MKMPGRPSLFPLRMARLDNADVTHLQTCHDGAAAVMWAKHILCMQLAVREAREKVADPEFQSEVDKFLEKVCKNLGDYAEMCENYVEQYAPLVFAVALDYLRPAVICVDFLHVCHHHSPPPSLSE